ncbi:MAG: complex I 51 kDa subunit family protein [Natronincolaceae bacterium]|jgi:NADH:ubiquinone oxidoreductase subunit F (NADH-binding)|nr:NADH-ubiquinone oxidoreductase-F iron-sulfur binding region domain-containing protein [Bacillota bacterium]NLK90155.1 NADH-quinone oxidoreductase subunit F [Clostridiales bacterium]
MGVEMRIVLRNYNKIDNSKIDDYIDTGGYKALEKAYNLEPIELIEELEKSGLRGRGGAGFNTGRKLRFTHGASGEEKFILCNADEGEPGTYKDRVIIQGDPHAILEGMAICGYAVGAKKGIIYLRAEYPYVADILKTAILQAKEKGVLGDFQIEICMGAGAYVCGEETALIESIEGKRGEPRSKPPYPPVSGLWGKPTAVFNVETLANIPQIIEKGSAWFAGIGDPSYPGTKVMTLTGDLVNKTFIEVPTDTTIRDIIYKFGGGIADGKQLQAVQIGGNSGALISPEYLDTSIAFDAMQKIGATLGSGAVFVTDESRNLRDVVCRISQFFEHESCGKCTPCREGTMRIHDLMQKICTGDGTKADLDLLTDLGEMMEVSCFCGLGQAAPVPILSAVKHFNLLDEERG